MILGEQELLDALCAGLVELAAAVGVDVHDYPALAAVAAHIELSRGMASALRRDSERRLADSHGRRQ